MVAKEPAYSHICASQYEECRLSVAGASGQYTFPISCLQQSNHSMDSVC